MDREHLASATKPVEPTKESAPHGSAAGPSASSDPNTAAADAAPPAQEKARDWRRWLGQHVGATGQTIDANLMMFRVGCLLTMAGSVVAVMRFSGAVRALPALQHSGRDPVVVFFAAQEAPRAHDPAMRGRSERLLRVPHAVSAAHAVAGHAPARPARAERRPRGASVWRPSGRDFARMDLGKLRVLAPLYDRPAAASPPFTRDFAHEIVANGYGECIPESLTKYDDGTGQPLEPLIKRLKQLETTQKHAQVMQYGIWKGWQEEKLSERVVSAGKRVTARGLQKLYNKIVH